MRKRSGMVFLLMGAVIVGAMDPHPAGAERLVVNDNVRSDRAAALAQEGQWQKAANIAARISQPVIRDGAYGRVAVILARTGRADRVRQALNRISDLGRRQNATVDVAIVLAKQNLLGVAEKMAKGLVPWRRDQVRAVIGMVQAEWGATRDGWRTASRTNDLARRREALITVRGGMASTLSPNAALGLALGAKTHDGRVRSLVSMARSMAGAGDHRPAVMMLAWARQLLQKYDSGAELRDRTAADAVMILSDMGDTIGARQWAGRVQAAGLRRYLLYHIDESRKFVGN